MAAPAAVQLSTAKRELEADLSRMAGLVEGQLQGAIAAFERRDIESASALIGNDQRIDAYDRDIEIRVINLLATQRLSEEEVRHATTVMKISSDLERVGDLAKNVAKRTLAVSQEAPTRATLGAVRMGRASLRQLSDILDAYTARNLDAAKAVWGGDDELDALYNSVFEEMLRAMMDEPKRVNACTHLVFIAKNFERVGDHATNIAEAIYFMVTGSMMTELRPKRDDTALMRVKARDTAAGSGS